MNSIKVICILVFILSAKAGVLKDMVGVIQEEFKSVHDGLLNESEVKPKGVITSFVETIEKEAIKVKDNIKDKFMPKGEHVNSNVTLMDVTTDHLKINIFTGYKNENEFGTQTTNQTHSGIHKLTKKEIVSKNNRTIIGNKADLQKTSQPTIEKPSKTDISNKHSFAQKPQNVTTDAIIFDDQIPKKNNAVVNPIPKCSDNQAKSSDESCKSSLLDSVPLRSNFVGGCPTGTVRAADHSCQPEV